MPELPEVETVRRGLEEHLIGKCFAEVSVTGRRTVRRQAAAELVASLEGRRVEAVRRKGKFIAVILDDARVLVIHLRMSGQLLWVEDAEEVSAPPLRPHTHVVARLGDRSELRFVDPRTFGEWYVVSDVGSDGLPADFSNLGPDPLLDGLSAEILRQRLAGRRVPLKAALTDQRVVAGIGSIYADEICFASRIRPDRQTHSLTPVEIGRLSRSTKRLLHSAVALGGSSLRDMSYRDVMGDAGSYQLHHKVYDRLGQRCLRCGTIVSRVRFGARVAYCCEGCQH
ncbi:MAG: bifunctional DNA-formamidopyrimidine glycosylase/DNA-(apurinic or apyrimidinic site) lyase [Actinomycetota bacterium]|nr:bifunctional DNA-formamidopyrimidine glycosylase/DNA-(apurinic or apyrimidinic site) lyase [Actinomycetota bacterium]